MKQNPNLARHAHIASMLDPDGGVDCAFNDPENRTPTPCPKCGGDAWMNPATGVRRCVSCREVCR